MPRSPIELYSAGDVIDKTLYAKVNVPVYRQANDSAQPFGNVAAGQPVGVVYSYLNVNPSYNRSTLWWMFKESTGDYYYTKQIGGYYDVDALRAQGVISVEEKIEEEKEKNLSTVEKLIKQYAAPAALVILGAAAISAAIKKV